MKSSTLKMSVAPFPKASNAENQALMETASAEQVSYQELLEIVLQTKHDQVESIEDKLENLIVQQQVLLQQSQANRPGLLTLPNNKQQWVVRQSQQQARLQVLHKRLDSVRELKEGMGMHSPKLEELAERKLRKHDPTLAQAWDSSLEAHRKHQALLRKQGQDKKRAETIGVGLSLILTKSSIR